MIVAPSSFQAMTMAPVCFGGARAGGSAWTQRSYDGTGDVLDGTLLGRKLQNLTLGLGMLQLGAESHSERVVNWSFCIHLCFMIGHFTYIYFPLFS